MTVAGAPTLAEQLAAAKAALAAEVADHQVTRGGVIRYLVVDRGVAISREDALKSQPFTTDWHRERIAAAQDRVQQLETALAAEVATSV